MSSSRNWLCRAGALALAFASAFATSAATPVTQGWAADPDDQYLLDVKLRQYRLGDGVRAYGTPEGTCIVFGDFLTTLDVPMKIDLTAKKASGWAFREANRISIDAGAGRVEYGGKAEALAAGAVRETPEGWCVESGALSRWFGIGVKPMTAGSALVIESEAKLPVELAMERERRSSQLKVAKLDLAALPQVRLPYRMWRAPALTEPVRPRVELTPGTRLVREWNGQTITVEVLEYGFRYADRTWRSLSEIARHVTDAHWSGPRFFGLTSNA